MRSLRVFVVPRWFPSLSHPVVGTFVQEQLVGMASKYPDLLLGVSTYSQIEASLQARLGILSNMKRVLAFMKPQFTRVFYSAQNLIHLDTPTLHWNPCLLGGNVKGIQRTHERHYLRFISLYGKPDIIHAHGAGAAQEILFLKEKYQLPLLITEHDLQINPVLYPALRAADAVIAVSSAQATLLRKVGVNNLKVIPNVVDEKRFFLRELPSLRPLTIATLSRIDHRKGISDLLHAFALSFKDLPVGTRLVIGGEGPELSAMKSLCTRLNLDRYVIWVGAVERQQVPLFLAQAHFFISASQVESFGLVLAEALAMGIPVISSASGGPSDFIHAENGILFPVGDVSQLGEAMVKMSEEYHLYTSQKTREDILRFCNASCIYAKIYDVYGHLL